MKSAKEKYDICETIMRILDGLVTEGEFQLFEKKLIESDEVCSIYMAILEAYTHMKRPGSSFRINAMGGDDDKSPFDELWLSLAKMEEKALAVEVEKTEQEPEPIQESRPFKRKNPLPLIVTTAAALFLVIFVYFAPVRTYYGQIIDTYQATFADSMPNLQRGEYLGDEPIRLEKGLVRIRMDDGSIVLLEAPSELRLEEDDQVFLIQGKLTADVPKSGIGFTVRTPSASIVDYGTEFGVSIDQYAKTEAHVMKGNVEMRLGSDLRVVEKAIRLSANQAGSVSGKTLSFIPAKLNRFTYEIPSSFETSAMKLDPLLYFRFKGNNIHTFGEVTGKNGVEILMGLDRQITPGPSFGNRYPTYALEMNGIQGLRIQNVLPVFASETGDYTVACWVCFGQIEKRVIWSNRVVNMSPGNDSSYYRVLWLNDEGKLEHTAYFPERKANNRTFNTIAGPAVLKPDQWYFVTITHAKGKYKSLYINGQLSARSTILQGNPLEKYNELTFGQSFEEFAPGFTGAISEILFFSRDLTAKENRMLYESALGK